MANEEYEAWVERQTAKKVERIAASIPVQIQAIRTMMDKFRDDRLGTWSYSRAIDFPEYFRNERRVI